MPIIIDPFDENHAILDGKAASAVRIMPVVEGVDPVTADWSKAALLGYATHDQLKRTTEEGE